MEKNKLVVIGGSSILLVALIGVIAVTLNDSASSNETTPLRTSSKSIQSICQPVDYKETCEVTLSAAANNTDDPKKLIKIAFQVTIDHIKQVFNQSSFVEDAANDKHTAEALENCKELLDYAVNDLEQSFDKLGDLDVSKIAKAIDDLKVWLSAAVTYQETCLDGFVNTNTGTGEKMRNAMKTGQELTSNVLAIVTQIGDLFGSVDMQGFFGRANRKLLNDGGEPTWFNPAKRQLLQLSPAQLKPDVTVAKDGSGDFATINEALLKVPKNSNNTFIIYIKAGVYSEQVIVARSMTNVMMVGDGPTKTKLTGSLNWVDGVSTFRTATLGVIGDGFIARDLGVENAAGAIKHQAVALRVQSDMSVFFNCQFDGYQDTLYAHTKRQFYRDCTISGTIDFIFGDAPSIFQNCLILVREPLSNQQNIITAQGRKDRREPTAIILHNCTITADPNFAPIAHNFKNYLGRPWKEFSRTFYIQCLIDDIIHPDGWLPWAGDFGLNTSFYSEIDNRGPGADMSKRVTWKAIKFVNYEHADKYSVQRFIQGNKWLPKTGVPYIAGLLPKGYQGSGIVNIPAPTVATPTVATPTVATPAVPTLAPPAAEVSTPKAEVSAPVSAPVQAPTSTPASTVTATTPTVAPVSAPALAPIAATLAPASAPALTPMAPVSAPVSEPALPPVGSVY